MVRTGELLLTLERLQTAIERLRTENEQLREIIFRSCDPTDCFVGDRKQILKIIEEEREK